MNDVSQVVSKRTLDLDECLVKEAELYNIDIEVIVEQKLKSLLRIFPSSCIRMRIASETMSAVLA